MNEATSTAQAPVVARNEAQGTVTGNTLSPEAKREQLIEAFKLIHRLLSVGLFPGGDAEPVVISKRVLENLIKDNSKGDS